MSFIYGQAQPASTRHFISKRKNMSLLHAYLKEGLDRGVYQPLEYLDTANIARDMVASGYDEKWARDPGRKDDYGLSKTIGDLLGGHGMKFRKIRMRTYVMPQTLPEVVNDAMIKEATY